MDPFFSWGRLTAAPEFGLSDVRLLPHYPAQSPLADVLRLVSPGSDEFITEKYAFEIESLLETWGLELKKSPSDMIATSEAPRCLDRGIEPGPRQRDDGAFRAIP